MKQLILLLTIVVLTTAVPKPYFRQHYQYQEQSEAYKDNELQHKKEKAERYSKVQDGTSEPIERSSVHQSEYNAPRAEEELRTKSLVGGNSQNYQQQASYNRNWNQQSGTHNSGNGYQDLDSQARRSQLQTGQNSGDLRSLPDSTGGHSSYSQWSRHSSYSYGQAPDHSTINQGHDTGYRRPNYDGLQTSQSLTSQTQQERQRGYGNSYFTQQKQDEVGRLQSGSQKYEQTEQREFGQGRRHFEHGQGHLNHGYDHGHATSQVNDNTQRLASTDDQTTGSTGKVSNQRTRTYFITSSNSNTDTPQNTGVRIVPSTQTGTVGTATQRRTYTASHSTNQQTPNIDDTFITHTVPQPVAPSFPSSDVGTVTHQTRRIYTASHSSNRQSPNTDSTFNINTASQNPSVEVGSGPQQTRTIYPASRYINNQPTSIDSSFNIDTVPQKPTGVIVPSSETGTVTQQTRRTYTASQVNKQSPNIDTARQKPSGVPLASYPSSDTGSVTHQTRRTSYTASQSSAVNKPYSIDDTFNANPAPQKISGVPVIPFPSSDTGTVHQTGRAQNTHTQINSAASPVPYPGYIRIIQPDKIIYTTTPQPYIIEPEEPTVNKEELKKLREPEEQPIRNPVQSSHQSRTIYQSSGFTRTHSTTNDQNEQKIEDINQQNIDLNKKSLDHQYLIQQTQDGFGTLEIGSQRRDDSEELTQQEEHVFEDQQTHQYKPTQNKPQYQPTQNKPQYQPTQNKPQYQTTNNQEGSYVRQIYRTIPTVRVQSTEFADIPQQSTTQKPDSSNYWKIVRTQSQENKTQQRKDFDYDDYEPTDQQQTRDLETEDVTQHEDVSNEDFNQHQTGYKRYEFNQQTQNNYGGHSQHRDVTQPKQSFDTLGQKHEDISQKTDSLGRKIPNDNLEQGSSYIRTNSYSSSSSYAQQQQQPQAVFSPVHVGTSTPGQFRVYQTMQIPAGTSTEMRSKLEEQMRQQLQQKMQELQSQQQSSHSSHVTYSPIHFGKNSGTGEFQVYQTMQIPAGATEEMRQTLQEQMRQQLEQKMQEVLQQQRTSSSYQQINVKPVVVHSYGGEALSADCDEQTGASYSNSYSSSSSSSTSGAIGGNHYSMQLRPGSSHSINQNMQIPTGYHHY